MLPVSPLFIDITLLRFTSSTYLTYKLGMPNDVTRANKTSAYYLPESSIKFPLTKTSKRTYCEWKGWASYYNINIPASPPPPPSQTSTTLSGTAATSVPSSTKTELIKERIWGYDTPTEGFKGLKGYVAFYVGPWDCYVDEEKVIPQPGDFYGGWTTSELTGLIKGDAATRWM